MGCAFFGNITTTQVSYECMKHLFLLLVVLFFPISCSAKKNIQGNPIEVGNVKWLRDHDKALNLSKKTGKPVFMLFQEVPG